MFRPAERLTGMGIGKRSRSLLLALTLLGATIGSVGVGLRAEPADAMSEVGYTFDDVAAIPSLTDGHARVFRLYWAFFDRQPDAEGALFWANRFSQCWSLERIANFFATSDEFVATYGTLTDAEFVDLIYRNVLDRTAEPAGRTFWEGEIISGRRTRVQVMLDFAYSTEFVANHPLASDGRPDIPCDAAAPDISAPGADGSILESDLLNTTLPTPLCGGFIRTENNVLRDGVTDGSTLSGEIGAYARVRADVGDGPYRSVIQGDMDENGIDDAAFILECVNSLGIVVDTRLIVLLDTGPAYTFEVRDTSVLIPPGSSVGLIDGVAFREPAIEVNWKAFGPDDPFCCPSMNVFTTFRVADGNFTRIANFVDGPDDVAREIADFVLSNDYSPIQERVTFDDFSALHEFQSTRGGLNFDDVLPCQLGGGGYSCLVDVPDWGQIGFLLVFDDGIWKLDSVAYDI